MGLRYRFYSGVQMLVVAAGIFGAALLYSGWGQAFFPSVALARQRMLAGSLALGGGLLGWYVFGRLRIGRWRDVGDEVGLAPESTVVGMPSSTWRAPSASSSATRPTF
jgi:hypothetical protein